MINAQTVAQICCDVLPASNKTGSDEYAVLTKELSVFEVNSEEAFRSLLTKHAARLLLIDKEEAQNALKIVTSAPPAAVERFRKGICYSHVGLARKALELEFGKTWQKHRDRFSEPKLKIHDRQDFAHGIPPVCPHSIQKFYKYRDIDQTRKLLETGTLAWSSPLLFNDPFDTQVDLRFDFEINELQDPLLHRLVEIVTSDDEPLGDSGNTFFLALGLARRDFKSGRWTRDELTVRLAPVAKQMTERLQHGLQKNQVVWREYLSVMRFLCLAVSNENVPMWEHYAKGGTGCAVEFVCPRDRPSIFWLAKPVSYSAGIPAIATLEEWLRHETGQFTLQLSDRFDRYAFSKSTRWSYEEEWRVARVLKNQTPEAASKKRDFLGFEPSDLSAIYFGYRASSEDLDAIWGMVKSKYPWVECFRTVLSPKSAKLEFQLLE